MSAQSASQSKAAFIVGVPFSFALPLLNGQSLDFQMDVGQTVFVLGANGTGKSSLMYRLYAANRQKARRISAHRQTWFD